jgi:hypothetical protein
MTRLRAHLFWMNGSLKATSGRAAAKQQNEDEENPGERTGASTATDTPGRGADALSWVHADSSLEEYNSGWHMAGFCRTQRAEDQVVGIWQHTVEQERSWLQVPTHTQIQELLYLVDNMRPQNK